MLEDYIYCQLGQNNVCIAISQLAEIVTASNMVRIDAFDTDKLWHKYENGKWSIEKFEPQTTAPLTEFEQLKVSIQATQEAVDFLLMRGM